MLLADYVARALPMVAHTFTVDVRSIPRIGGEPFSLVMREASGLKPGEVLRVLAACESIPLFEALGGTEFSHEAHPIEQDDWEVLFTRMGPAERSPSPAPAPSAAWAAPSSVPVMIWPQLNTSPLIKDVMIPTGSTSWSVEVVNAIG